MKELENKCLRFVLHYYQKDKLDTPKTLKAFKEKNRISVHKHSSFRTFLFTSGAAAIILLAVALHTVLRPDSERTVITAHAQRVNYLLPDSSLLTLYPYSSVSFCKQTYQNDQREIQMKGKVAFTVRHDETHPFRVLGRLTQTVVLGTQFTVDESRQDTASVQVTTGKVRLTSLQGTESVILTKGMTAQIVKGETKPRMISQKQEIRKGSFLFENTPLSQVLEQLSRYYQVRLTTQTSDRRLTARFEERSLDEIIEIIEKVLKVKIRKEKP